MQGKYTIVSLINEHGHCHKYIYKRFIYTKEGGVWIEKGVINTGKCDTLGRQ